VINSTSPLKNCLKAATLLRHQVVYFFAFQTPCLGRHSAIIQEQSLNHDPVIVPIDVGLRITLQK